MKYLFILLLGAIIIVFACKKKKNSAPQGDDEIWLLYQHYNPTLKEIKKGSTLKFVNKDNANHSASDTKNKFASGKIKPGDQWQNTFNDTGYYSVYCNYHPDNLSEQLYLHVKAN